MYNYLKNGVTLNAEVMALVNDFNGTARTLATESVEHTAKKHELEDSKSAIEKNEELGAEEKVEKIATINTEIEELDNAWTTRRKELEVALFGGKDDNGNKIAGICDIVKNDLYKAYVDFIQNGTKDKYREALREFCGTLVIGGADALKEGAYNHLYNDIVQTMSSVRYNSNSQLAKGATFITTVNKKVYKKMLLGAIADIVSNNKTLKVKKDKNNK